MLGAQSSAIHLFVKKSNRKKITDMKRLTNRRILTEENSTTGFIRELLWPRWWQGRKATLSPRTSYCFVVGHWRRL